MPESITQRWTFSQPSPIGEVRSCYAMTAEGVQFSSDAAMHAGSEMLRWDAIVEAATAVVELPAGKGGPDMPRWMPGRLEWLVVSRSGEDAQAFMRPLPTAEARDAIVAAMRSRLGSRWVGERLSLEAARQRLGTPARGGSTMSVAWLVLTVLALLLALLMLVALLASVLAIPAEFALGAWSFHRGLAGLRDALHGLNTPASRVASAAMGFVKLEGRAVADRPSAAGVSGRPSVWWDVAVDVYDDSQDDGGWKQVAARHGGSADALVIEDETGRLPVWLRDADLLLQQHTWEPGQDALPAGGSALLESIGLARDGARLRLRERRMEAGGPLYVLGTLDEARHLPAAGDERGLARALRSLHTGAWRAALLRAVPPFMRMPLAVVIAYLDMLFRLGRGGERAQRPEDSPPPTLPGSAPLVWKGHAGRPLVVSDQRETAALAQLRKRSLVFIAFGVIVLCHALHELINMF